MCVFKNKWKDFKPTTQYLIDHVIPLSKGGNHSCGNIVISCKHCNEMKNNKLPIEFKIYRKKIGTF